MCAAVADFRPTRELDGKLERSDTAGLTLELEATDDILASLAAERRPGQVLVGFAADHGSEGLRRARAKLERKRVDLIAYNDISEDGIGFDAQDNALTLVSALGDQHVERASKRVVADALLDVTERLGP
jgi:phosphopantothenoylcysteine decarboxylase/phosphopantothenate--cysteine ligase